MPAARLEARGWRWGVARGSSPADRLPSTRMPLVQPHHPPSPLPRELDGAAGGRNLLRPHRCDPLAQSAEHLPFKSMNANRRANREEIGTQAPQGVTRFLGRLDFQARGGQKWPVPALSVTQIVTHFETHTGLRLWVEMNRAGEGGRSRLSSGAAAG